MPHPNQQGQQNIAYAVEVSRRDGHHSAEYVRAFSDGQGSPDRRETDTHVVDLAALLAEMEGLRQRLASQPVIEQAKGILMRDYSINQETAFQLLSRWSQEANTKLRRIAEQLTESAASGAGSRLAPPEIVQEVLRRPSVPTS